MSHNAAPEPLPKDLGKAFCEYGTAIPTEPDVPVQKMVEVIENNNLTVVVTPLVLDVMIGLCGGGNLDKVVTIGAITSGPFAGHLGVTGFPPMASKDFPDSPGPESDSDEEESDPCLWPWEAQKLGTPLNNVLYAHLEMAAALATDGGQAVTKEWTDSVGSFKGTAQWRDNDIVTIVTTPVSVCGDTKEVCTTCRLLMTSHGVLAADVRMPDELAAPS